MNEVLEQVGSVYQADNADLLDLWHELAGNPDSPDRIEITEHGEIRVSPPPTSRHQTIGYVVREQIEMQLGGRALAEIPVLTRDAGIRQPDVVWLPLDRSSESLVDGPMETVPPLVVEVLSPRNRKSEIEHKASGYLASGAQEVIIIDLDGTVIYRRTDGQHSESAMGVKLELPAELFSGRKA